MARKPYYKQREECEHNAGIGIIANNNMGVSIAYDHNKYYFIPSNKGVFEENEINFSPNGCIRGYTKWYVSEDK